MKQILSIEPNTLKCLAAFISTDETRYVLNGICVRHRVGRQVEVAATDGRRLGKLTMRDQKAELELDIIIPSAAIHAALSAFEPRNGPIVATYEPETHSVTLTQLSMAHPTKIVQCKVEGNYPNYDMVIPAPIPTAFVYEKEYGLNASFLAECAALLEHVAPRSAACTIGRDAGGPLVFQGKGGDVEMIAVQMPMRTA